MSTQKVRAALRSVGGWGVDKAHCSGALSSNQHQQQHHQGGPDPQECMSVRAPEAGIVVCGASCSANTAELLLRSNTLTLWEEACDVGGLESQTRHRVISLLFV